MRIGKLRLLLETKAAVLQLSGMLQFAQTECELNNAVLTAGPVFMDCKWQSILT